MPYELIRLSDGAGIRQEESPILTGTKVGFLWLPVNNVAVDTSTGPDKVTDAPVRTVHPDLLAPTEVRYTRTTRDMTAQEISDRDDSVVDTEARQAVAKLLYVVFCALHALDNNERTRGSATAAARTPAQFRSVLDTLMEAPPFTFAEFKSAMKDFIDL